MDDTEIKQEFCALDNLCRVCLSAGRKLSPVKEYQNILKTIVSDLEFKDQFLKENIQLCWECIAVLRKVCLFQQMVQKTQKMCFSGQYIYGPLSSLTTIILNDTQTHTLYMYENTHTSVSDGIYHCDNYEDRDNCDIDDKCDNLKSEAVDIPVLEQKKVKNNRWATRRALQNKKPKFKIVTDYTKQDFKKIQIKNEDLLTLLDNERNSDYFGTKKYKCLNCIKTFCNEKLLLEHNYNYHKKMTPYICDICNSYMSSKRHLAEHISKHYYKYACTLCDFNCYDKSQKEWHFRKKHAKIFQCVKCQLDFGNRKVFFKHHKDFHEKFICDICGVSFKMKYCIKEHIRKQHSPFECKMCDRRFARYNGLWLHNKTCHNDNATTMYCVECDRRYPDVYRYKWHLSNSAKHNRKSKTRVPCPGCEKVFSKKIYMKDHYNLVHLKFYKYRCEQCDKNFIRNADLVKHKRRIHEGILPPKNKICYICGRGFSTNKILSNHITRHTGSQRSGANCNTQFGNR